MGIDIRPANVGRFGPGHFGQSFLQGRTFWPAFDFITWI